MRSQASQPAQQLAVHFVQLQDGVDLDAGRERRGIEVLAGILDQPPAQLDEARGVEIRDARTVGKDGSHLQFQLKEGRVSWRAISFRNAEFAVPTGERADIVYTFRRDNLRGTLQLEVLDLRPAE